MALIKVLFVAAIVFAMTFHSMVPVHELLMN